MEESLDEGIRRDIKKRSFKFFRDFHNIDEAKNFIAILEENDILYLAETSETILDESIVGTGLLPKAIIKLLPEDFKTVNAILNEQFQQLEYWDIRDHHLNELDDNELKEILERPDEWAIEDTSIAKLILNERGIQLSDQDILNLRKERLKDIRKGKKGDKIWMVLYFLFIPLGLIVSEFFTIAGIGMGYYYAYGKNTDIDGHRYHTFDEETRKYGKVILFGGLISLLFIVLIFFKMINN